MASPSFLNIGGLDRVAQDPSMIFKMNDIRKETQTHLARVYTLLAGMVGAAIAGGYVAVSMGIGGAMFSLLGLGLVMYLMWGTSSTDAGWLRPGLVLGFGFLQGLAIRDLLAVAVMLDASMILTAALLSLGIFVAFSLAALVAKRRSWLFLGGIVGSVVFWLAMASLLNIFMRSRFLFDVNLYGGLAIFMAYILFDTQVIIEKAEAMPGHADAVRAALDLFIDLFAIFVRILVILIRNSGKEKKDRRRR